MADDPNKRSISSSVYYLFSSSDVDSFLSRFNHENNYTDGDIKLNVGDNIVINDGIYDKIWRIAGFDIEHNVRASDGTTYDNGYGIMLYPRWFSTAGYWNSSNTTSGGYMNSLAHSTTNQIAINMKNSIFGAHLINRNVLLSSAVSSSGTSSAATWTTAYGVLPSAGQIYGAYATTINGHDDGEGFYKLPLFSYNIVEYGNDRWVRNIYGKSNSDYMVYYIKTNNVSMEVCAVNYSPKCYYPLLYIR